MNRYLQTFILSFTLLFFVACGGNSSSETSIELGAFHNDEFSLDFDDSWKVIRNMQVLQDNRVTRGNIIFTLLHKTEDTYSAVTVSKDEFDSKKNLEDFGNEVKDHLSNTLKIENIESSGITIDSQKTDAITFSIEKQKYFITFISRDSILYYFVGSTTNESEDEIENIESVIQSFQLIKLQ